MPVTKHTKSFICFMNIRKIPSCTLSIKQNVKYEKQQYLYSDSVSTVLCMPPPQNKVLPGSSSNGFFHTLHQILQLMWHLVSFTFVVWLFFYSSSVLSFCGRRYIGLLSHVPSISQFHNHIISYHFFRPFWFF